MLTQLLTQISPYNSRDLLGCLGVTKALGCFPGGRSSPRCHDWVVAVVCILCSLSKVSKVGLEGLEGWETGLTRTESPAPAVLLSCCAVLWGRDAK